MFKISDNEKGITLILNRSTLSTVLVEVIDGEKRPNTGNVVRITVPNSKPIDFGYYYSYEQAFKAKQSLLSALFGDNQSFEFYSLAPERRADWEKAGKPALGNSQLYRAY